jgi:hypothetical protein
MKVFRKNFLVKWGRKSKRVTRGKVNKVLILIDGITPMPSKPIPSPKLLGLAAHKSNPAAHPLQKKKIIQYIRLLISQGGTLLIADFTGTLQTDLTAPVA